MPVSDGRQVVLTDAKGKYKIVTDKADSILFITTPSGYRAKMMDPVRPSFWRILTAAPSKTETHNFELEKEDQSNYSILFITDCHLVNDPKRNDLDQFRKNVFPVITREVENERKKGLVYTINLGDFTQDAFWYANDFNEMDGKDFIIKCGYPTPVYSVTGNHDNDPSFAHLGDANDFMSAWCYRHTWGPACYSVNIGGDHWVFMDGIEYRNDGEPRPKNTKGVNGYRNFNQMYQPHYLQWLENDLKYVSADTRIFFCTHIPILYSRNGKLKDHKQMAELDRIFSKFDHVTVYSGHTHMFDNFESGRYERFRQYTLVSTSGCTWHKYDGYPLVAEDGGDPSITILDCSQRNPIPRFVSIPYGDNVMRIYDMNEVGKFYARDIRCIKYFSICPNLRCYSDPQFKNMVMVNYWVEGVGETVEILENGKKLDVERVNWRDPVAEQIHFIRKIDPSSSEYKKSYISSKKNGDHLFIAKASTPDADIVVNIRNSEGKIIHTKTMRRPQTFTPELAR